MFEWLKKLFGDNRTENEIIDQQDTSAEELERQQKYAQGAPSNDGDSGE
ncbi:hypothetical protein [Photobacterium damselae]|nr:hypothetical protein [Photobacterium damselae]